MNQKGFTLVEIMIVVAIISAMAIVAMPGFQTWLDSQRVTSSSLDIKAAFETAKSTAISNQQNVGVQCTVGTGQNASLVVFIDNGANFGVLEAGERVVKQTVMKNNVELYLANFQGPVNTVAHFNPIGLAAGTSGEIRIRNAGVARYRRIVLTNAGNIRIERSINGLNGSWSE